MARRLVVITGAPGVGKSAVAECLVGRLDDGVVIDGDLTGRPEYSNDMSLLRTWLREWLRVAGAIADGGRYLALALFVRPREIDEHPEGTYFDDIVFLALVCDADQHASRLRDRPKSAGISDEGVASLIALDREMRAVAASDARVTLVDTSGRTARDVADEVVRSVARSGS